MNTRIMSYNFLRPIRGLWSVSRRVAGKQIDYAPGNSPENSRLSVSRGKTPVFFYPAQKLRFIMDRTAVKLPGDCVISLGLPDDAGKVRDFFRLLIRTATSFNDAGSIAGVSLMIRQAAMPNKEAIAAATEPVQAPTIIINEPEHIPSATQMFFDRGIKSFKLKQYAQAVFEFTEVLNNDPNNIYALACRAFSQVELNEGRAAIADYDKAIELGYRCAEVFCNRGIAKRMIGSSKEAIVDYTEALKFDPCRLEILRYRAESYWPSRQFEEAIADYDKVLELKPGSVPDLIARGWVKQFSGNNEGAIADFDLAIKLDPKYYLGYQRRGTSRYNLGQKAESEADLNIAFDLAPGHTEKDHIEQLLRLQRKKAGS